MLSMWRVQTGSAAAHSDGGMTSACRITKKPACPQQGATLIYYY